MICWNWDGNKHHAEGLKTMTCDARTKIPLISQCKETHLYFPHKRHVKATRGARPVCRDSDPPRPGPGSPRGPPAAAPVPSLSAHLTDQLRSQKVSGELAKAIYAGCCKASLYAKRQNATQQRRRRGEKRSVLRAWHEPHDPRDCHRERQGSFRVHRGEKGIRKERAWVRPSLSLAALL